MTAIVRFHKSLIASAIGLFVFLAVWSLTIAVPQRPIMAALAGGAAATLIAYYFFVVRRKYG